MKKLLCAAIIFATPFSLMAGVYGPTSHSRANCVGFNESISWWAGHPDYRRAVSYHFRTPRDPAPHHVVDTGMHNTFRAAAYHPTEAYAGDTWRVVGYHFYLQYGQQTVGAVTEAVDCNIYDGWWG